MLKIIHSDSSIIAVDKPAGWLSVPGRGGSSANAPIVLVELRKSFDQVLPVHRLDRFTSGVLIFARSKDAQTEACSWFQNHNIEKTYHFFATPTPTSPVLRCSSPLDEKPSSTFFRVDKSFSKTKVFFGSAQPRTGRFHQIRRHAILLGFSILGEPKFHSPIPVSRIMLHASLLKTPCGNFSTNLPNDFIKALEVLV